MLIDKFLEIEEAYQLYDRKIDNINLWLFIRTKIFADYILTQEYNLSSGPKIDRNVFYKIKKVPQYVLSSIVSLLKTRLDNKDILLICHPRRIQNNKGFYEDIYTDRIEKNFKNTVSIEEPFCDIHFRPAETHNILYIDIIDLFANIGYIIKKNACRNWRRKQKEDVYHFIQDPINAISKEYSVIINSSDVVEICCYYLYKIKCFEKLYERLLSKTRPKLIVETVSYSLGNMVLNTVAHRKNIKIIELQHGHISSDHEGYHFSGKRNRMIEQLPDELYLFSDYYINMVQMPEVKLCTVGYPFFEDNLRSFDIDNSHKENRKNIIFISNYNIGKRLSKIALELSNEIQARKMEWRVIFKLHPSECDNWETSYPELKGSDSVVVAGDHKTSIYDYLAISEYAIGLNSTALYEALGFGVKVIIYDDDWEEYIEDGLELVKNGYADLARSTKDIVEVIESSNSSRREDDVIDSKFWPINANENLYNRIKTTLSTRSDSYDEDKA